MPVRHPPDVLARYDAIRKEGWSRKEAATRAGVSYNWASNRDRKLTDPNVAEAPRKASRLRGPAKDALSDFDLFRRRYFGRISTPWQAIAAHRLAELLVSDRREFVVMNSPPGSGKSTLFTHDIPAWLTVRNRALRGLIGSKSLRQAQTYTGRLRRSMGRRTIEQANPDLVARGRAMDAEAVLSRDYGTFRPNTSEVWTRGEFTVAQLGGEDVVEKEPTWTAFGMDSASLGWRVDYAVWDDVFDKCQPYDEPVRMADGSERATGDLVVGDEVLGAYGPTEVVGVADNGTQPVYEVRTLDGRRFRCTANHPVLTPDGWVDALDVDGHGVRVATIHGPNVMHPQVAWFLGLLVGDGGLTHHPTVTIADPDVLREARAACHRLGWTLTARGKYGYYIKGGARSWLEHHELWGTNSRTKRVPPEILTAGAETIAAYLTGYLDSDGSVDKTRSFGVCYVSVNEPLLLQTQELLARLNIPSRLVRRTGVYKGERRPSWLLRIGVLGAALALRWLHPRSAKKADRLKEHLGAKPLIFDLTDRVVSVTPVGELPTRAVETADHTLVLGGIVTHNSILRSYDAIERQQEWWVDEVETRIEPEGLLVLQGQRMANHDIYRFALDQVTEEFPDDDPDSEPITTPLYVHIKYPAHDESICEGNHGRLAKAWPDGCLLDPMRNGWTHLRNQQLKGDQKFRLLYQQEDIDVEGALVSPIWLEGGHDHHGHESPGCWDDERGPWQFPKGLTGRQILVATADPSAANYWAIELWLYHPETEQRFLIDLVRRKMSAPEFLDYNANDAEFHGVMHEWQTASKALGHPISHWIIEQNACQRWLLQYEHTKRWMAKMGVSIVGHETARNKSDPELGVQSIASHYRYGRVRLPGTREGKAVCAPMVKELTTYPEGLTDDCVMAHWFFEWNIAKLSKPRNEEPPKMKRPQWLTRSDRHWRAVAALGT